MTSLPPCLFFCVFSVWCGWQSVALTTLFCYFLLLVVVGIFYFPTTLFYFHTGEFQCTNGPGHLENGREHPQNGPEYLDNWS